MNLKLGGAGSSLHRFTIAVYVLLYSLPCLVTLLVYMTMIVSVSLIILTSLLISAAD